MGKPFNNIVLKWITIILTLLLSGCNSPFEPISKNVLLTRGYVNGVQIRDNGEKLMIYGDPSGQVKNADQVLFTHNRRELIAAGRKLVENGAIAVMPASAADNVVHPDDFWHNLLEERKSYFGGRFTNRAVKSMQISEKVQEGDTISWQGFDMQVLETPGYDENAVSYITNIDGKRYAFVGDLIYDKGRIADIYHLQAAVEDTRIGRYHGYMGRMGDLIRSLQRIKAEDPDIMIPSRGKVIHEPSAAINSLIERLQEVYKNYLAISSVRWYFGDDLKTLTTEAQINLSEVDTTFFAEKLMDDPPSWIIPIANSRLMVSEDGSGFLSDCGSEKIIEEIEQLIREGKINDLEGVFITHYHGDHVNRINELVDRFGCKIYASEEMQDILENPDHFSMPYTGISPLKDINYVKDGEEMQWHEFSMKFFYFPGQTMYHGAMWVDNKKIDTDIFFIGDSFSPTGIDDYSLQNRNFLHKDMGYYKCLKMLKAMNKKKAPYYLINQHIHPPFWFSNEQIDTMIANLDRRRELFSALFPRGNLNFGIDPQWAALYPYQIRKNSGEKFKITLKIMNHYENESGYNVDLSLPDGFSLISGSKSTNVEALKKKELNFTLDTSEDIPPGLYVIPATVQNSEHDDLAINIECCVEIH